MMGVNMIRCMIVDDEKPARDELSFLLEDFDDIQVLAQVDNGRDAIEIQKNESIDLVFLDINMPVITGIRVAEKWMALDQPPMIIFTTAYDEYAIRAFDLNAVDYILKPISCERLSAAIKKVRDKTLLQQKKEIGSLAEKMASDGACGMDKICFESGGRYIPLDISAIVYATIKEKHTLIYTTQGAFDYGHSLSYLEERLHSDKFFRSHRAYLMNIEYVEAIEPWFNNTYMVKMKGYDEKVPVARNQIKSFKETFNM